MRGLPASIADQEDAIVEAIRMIVRHISVRALDPPSQVGADEQVEDAVNAVRGDTAALGLRTFSAIS
jgi:hypothetical protein